MRHLRQYQFILLGWSLRPPTTQQLAHCHIHLPRWRGNLPSLVPAETGKEGGRVSSAQQNFLRRTVNKSKEYLDQSRIKKTPWIWGTQHCLHAYPLCSSCVWLEYRGATPAHVVILAPGLQPASTHTRTRHPRNAAHAQYLLAGNEPLRSLKSWRRPLQRPSPDGKHLLALDIDTINPQYGIVQQLSS